VQLHIRSGNQNHIVSCPASALNGAEAGDLIQFQSEQVSVATPNRHPEKQVDWMKRVLDPRRQKAMRTRSQVEATIRSFFLEQNFLETRTPLLVPCPGMEPHIRPFQLKSGAYLPTSPEFAMKRLLVGGLEKIFQICPSFRYEPTSPTHSPEFTMLEWYRAWASYEEIMVDTETLFATLAQKVLGCEPGREFLVFQGKRIDLARPWPRLRVRDLFEQYCGINLVQEAQTTDLRKHCERLKLGWNPEDTWDDLYFRIWLNEIEPKLPADRAVFVTRYPASQAALAVVDQDEDGSTWARRFETYAGGMELGNAFEELTHPGEQRRRFEEDMELRAQLYGPNFPKTPLDEGFLSALEEGMPPAGGIAMGVDRIVMLFADEPELDQTLWLQSFAGDETVSTL
jgi:lysyl-tRNA synthetase class 2